MNHAFSLVAVAGLASSALAQSPGRFLVADRTANAVWAIDDVNGNALIDEPSEVWVYFNSANAAGTINVDNPNAMAVGPGPVPVVAIGDQLTQSLYLLRDLNGDGDAQDVGESVIGAGPGNGSGLVLSFPTGLAFDPAGTLYMVNAGNASGPDAIYRFVDLDSDGRYMSVGEIQPYVTTGVFGPGNGPYSPQEIVFLPSFLQPVGFLHNSSSGLNGVFRFVDNNNNGRADDPGEFTAYFDSTNASGITLSAGFALEPDRARPESLYLLQIATGGVDQLIRLTDLNNDGDANDAGEAVVVYSEPASGFSAIDCVSLADGRVLITDVSGRRVYLLTDADHDDQFTTAGEAAVFDATTVMSDPRILVSIGRACGANCDNSTSAPVLNVNDFICFQGLFASGDPGANCDSSTSAPILNVNDFICFQGRFAAGCP